MKLVVEIYRDYDHATRTEFTIEGNPDVLNKILRGVTLGEIAGDLTLPVKEKEE